MHYGQYSFGNILIETGVEAKQYHNDFSQPDTVLAVFLFMLSVFTFFSIFI